MFLAKIVLQILCNGGAINAECYRNVARGSPQSKKLFEEFEHTKEEQSKEQIVEHTLRELEVHAALEEEIFYPAAEEQIGERDSIDEAREEHHVVKLLIGELKKMN